MNKSLALIALAFLFANSNISAQTWEGLHWTDGAEDVVGHQLCSTQVLLEAANNEDNGYGYLFNIKKTGTDSYDLKGTTKALAMPKDRKGILYDIVKTKNFKNDATANWKRKEVNGMDLLLNYEDGKLISIFEQTSSDRNEFRHDKELDAFAGKYKDENGKVYEFSNDGTCTFAGKKTTFLVQDEGLNEFCTVNACCINVEGKLYKVWCHEKGLRLYNATVDEDGMYFAHDIFAELTTDMQVPRWSYTSKYPCCACAISFLSTDVMRLMRNEIYARHGWTFKDPKLNSYFKSQSWYKPLGDNSKIKLSEMELLNVAILKKYE